MNRLILDFLVILLLWFLHITFFGQLSVLTFLNLPLLYLLLRLAFNYKSNIWWLAIFLGLLNDLYSLYYFGFYLVIYLVTTWLTYVILHYFFTNRSLFSLILGVIIGLSIFKFIQLIIIYFNSSFNVALLWLYMKNIFISLVGEVLVLFIFIFLANLFFHKKNV